MVKLVTTGLIMLSISNPLTYLDSNFCKVKLPSNISLSAKSPFPKTTISFAPVVPASEYVTGPFVLLYINL